MLKNYFCTQETYLHYDILTEIMLMNCSVFQFVADVSYSNVGFFVRFEKLLVLYMMLRIRLNYTLYLNHSLDS